MKMTMVRLVGLNTIDLPVVDALPSDRYILETADGLGPPDRDVSIAETLNAGGVFQGSRPQNREVVLEIGLNPDHGSGQTASDLREELYGLLTPGPEERVQIQVMNGKAVQAYTEGYVKRVTPTPFSKDPSVQITIPCLEPYLRGPSDLFVDPGPNKLNPVIQNFGTAPADLVMNLVFAQSMAEWSITNDRGQKIHIKYPIQAGDSMTLDMRKGKRDILVARGTGTFGFISALTPDSQWFELHGGVNRFTTSSQAFTWRDIYYRPQFWGV